jgi:oligopeptide/dipeptide ABC transporter ATP-binding protein
VTPEDLLGSGLDDGPPPPPGPPDPLLSVRDLHVEFRVSGGRMRSERGRALRALDGVDLELQPGQSVAVVGESGSGKTTLGRVICRLQHYTSGQVTFRSRDVERLRGAELAGFRRQVQMIFQDPYSSLDPRIRVGAIIAEPLTVNRVGTTAERRRRVVELLDTVGLPRAVAARLPYELSGGQRQRVAIARALALSPQLIVADEPTSALDVSAQAQILTLLDDLRREMNLSLVYITHNLPTALYVADNAVVMYLGRVIESGPVTDVLLNPQHPYTAALSAAAPTLDGPEGGRRRQDMVAVGELPDPTNPPTGCRFHTRCWFRSQVPDAARCERVEPPRVIAGTRRQAASCHFSEHLQKWLLQMSNDTGRDA